MSAARKLRRHIACADRLSVRQLLRRALASAVKNLQNRFRAFSLNGFRQSAQTRDQLIPVSTKFACEAFASARYVYTGSDDHPCTLGAADIIINLRPGYRPILIRGEVGHRRHNYTVFQGKAACEPEWRKQRTVICCGHG
ncbi:hypothetical protein D3C75_1092920 [compost metagenome]